MEDEHPGFHPPDICPEFHLDKRTSSYIYDRVEGEKDFQNVLECFSRESLCQYILFNVHLVIRRLRALKSTRMKRSLAKTL